jgi:hypothetical protein
MQVSGVSGYLDISSYMDSAYTLYKSWITDELNHVLVIKEKPQEGERSGPQGRCILCCERCGNQGDSVSQIAHCMGRLGRKMAKSCSMCNVCFYKYYFTVFHRGAPTLTLCSMCTTQNDCRNHDSAAGLSLDPVPALVTHQLQRSRYERDKSSSKKKRHIAGNEILSDLDVVTGA